MLDLFRAELKTLVDRGELHTTVIGEGVMIPGLNGDVPLVYADYVASGRAMRPVETFIMEKVLPFYANSHTEASFCGGKMTRLRREARAEIARHVGATQTRVEHGSLDARVRAHEEHEVGVLDAHQVAVEQVGRARVRAHALDALRHRVPRADAVEQILQRDD